MNKQELFNRIDKIFRANTTEKFVETGQFGEGHYEKRIENIQELKDDIKSMIESEFKRGKIDLKEIFFGSGNKGASYHISVSYNIAKEWGYKYLEFNGQIFEICSNGEIKDTGITVNEL